VLNWQLLVGHSTRARGVNDRRCDEGGMQFPPGVEMAGLLTGESVCLCNGGKGRGRAGFLIFRCRRPGAEWLSAPGHESCDVGAREAANVHLKLRPDETRCRSRSAPKKLSRVKKEDHSHCGTSMCPPTYEIPSEHHPRSPPPQSGPSGQAAGRDRWRFASRRDCTVRFSRLCSRPRRLI
jgi:hypothetical protein